MTELQDFIAHAQKKGMDSATITSVLTSNGWKEKDIAEAMAEATLEKPIPMPPDSGGARDAFFHLLSFAALYTVVISTIIMFFQYIDRLFPDPTETYYSSDSYLGAIRWSMAAVIVAFPLLLWMSRFINAEMRKTPEKSWSGIRRWLTYITLFIAAFTLMVDVITLIFSFLEGELSTRFVSKVGIIFVIVGLTFTYYFTSLKSHPKEVSFRRTQHLFIGIASAIVLTALVWGGLLVGSPMTGRLQRFDETRLQHLRSIQSEINSIVYEDAFRVPSGEREPVQEVPFSLQEMLNQAEYSYPTVTDPQTGEEYGYQKISAYTYDLCAQFAFTRDESYDIFWNHPAGSHCFRIDATENR